MSAASVTVARDDLLPALKPASDAVEKRTTIPILQNLLLAVEDGRLTVTGTDLDVEISASAPCAGAKAARFTLPSALFYDSVRKLPDKAELTITVDPREATIAAGRARFRMPVLPAEDFPSLAAGELPHGIALGEGQLARMLAAVGFAISTEETRYYLNGVHLHRDGERLVAVATDGHRLSKYELPLPQGADGLPAIIVPRRTVTLAGKIFGDAPVTVSLSDSKIRFTSGDRHPVTLTSKLIDGTFPDYRRVVPPSHPNAFTVEREALAKAVDRVVTISAGQKGSAVRFAFAPEGLTLSARNAEVGEAEDFVAVQSAEGDAVVIGFNGRYCLDMLGAVAAERVTFQLGTPGEPARVVPEGAAEHLVVLMPMSLGAGG